MNYINRIVFAILIGCCISNIAIAQNISIPGITGVDFDTTGGDYSISFTTDFTVHGIDVTSSGLTLVYSDADETLSLYGTATASMDGESISVSLGDDSNPGLVITNGSITQVVFGLSTDFTIRSMTLSPDNLTFEYDFGNSYFEIYGDLTMTLGEDEIAAGLGDVASPGLIVSNGDITDINMSITANFDIDGLTIDPDALTLVYSEADSQYETYGDVSLSLDGNTLNGTLGDEDDPGFVVESGSLTSFNIAVSGNFDLKAITIEPDGLTFQYDSGSDHFEMYGAATTTIDANSIDISLGDGDTPGIVVDEGSLTSINFGITADFDMKGITISPTDLTLQYDSPNSHYEFFGDLTVKMDGEEVDASLGDADDPGMVFKNGSITHINFGVTADFEIKGITVSPEGFTFEYDSGEDYFELYGSVTVKFDGEEVDATLGDSDDPGIVFDSGTITHVNFGLTADFEIKSLGVIPDDLTFEYDSGSNHFEMYGDITFKIGSDEITANMGDSDDPGLVYKDNSITHVNIGVTSDFKFSGMKVKTTDVGVEWNSGTDFHLYGDANLSIENETVDADFGTNSNPGLVIRSGELHSFEVDINSDIKLGNLEVEAKDLDIKYSSSKFEVRGELEITEIFSLSVTLGEGDQAGLEIDVSGLEPKFKIEALEIDIEHANLGAIDLKLFELKFNSSGIEESAVKVIFPQGWEVDADLKFTGNPAKLNEIEIDYRADNLSDAIEIFEGVQLAYLGASVKNLTRPSRLEVGGTIESIYGGGFSLAGKSATLLEMRDEVTITHSSFDLKGDVNVGAYRTGTDSWHSLLGSGSIDLYARFGHYIRAKAKVKIPGDPLIEADATVYLDNHQHFDALLDVEFIVPHWVPFIGGKHYGSVDGAIRYKKGDLHGSYGAAWVRIHTFWHTYHTGAKYNFGTRKAGSIGSGSISSIESQIKRETGKTFNGGLNLYDSKIHTFQVPQPAPNSMMIDIDWTDEVDSALITVIGPEGVYELTKATIISENDSTTTPTMGYEENMDYVAGDTSTTFIFTTPTAFSQEEVVHSNLLDGRYQLVISFPGDTASIDSVQFLPIWQEPEVSISVEETDGNRFELEADYWSSLPDSTIISFYVEGVGDSNEVKIIDHVYASNFDNDGYGTETLSFIPDFIERLDTLYFYTVIDDGVNPPLTSDTTDGYEYSPDIFGFLNFPADVDSLEGGLRLFVDEDVNGSFDTESTGGLELFAITDSLGYFAVSGLIPDEEYEIRIVLPPGYRLVGGVDRFSPKIINFDGDPIELTLEIEAYTEAE